MVRGTSITTCDPTHHAGRIVSTDPVGLRMKTISKKGERSMGLSYYCEFTAPATVTAGGAELVFL